MNIRKYQNSDFYSLCKVMDRARMQELKQENLEEVFIKLQDAPYFNFLMSLNLYVAVEDKKLVGFVGYEEHYLQFIYIDPDYQKRGIATELLAFALKRIKHPVCLSVFTNNLSAKHLYKKFGFKVIKTKVEKWSDSIPKLYSEDKMELW